ncbi:hypothetical protein SAMN02745166_03397 [Prosthecobacter debontii]|uniref:Uncharacterized protein n=1 Tax=Prosthecobacter debontii TaxID=48467 RepID=A0A1T4YI75_9BACT|nr:Amuc_1099 family pilus-like system protein [Prosthecobacter debontii]SKB01537.1 hypothetical protein SAMN02745166_03397 [Prosthecobacter debontii]
MQNRNGNYEKVLLGVAAAIALGVAGYLVWTSQSFSERLVRRTGNSKNDPGQPPTALVDATIKRLTEKTTWVSPVINGKPVPLNKSILLVKKGDQLFDLQLEEPQLRPPMTNSYLVQNDLPNILSPNVGDLDADADGFSNLEEFNAKTSPRDPKSHPPFTDKLVLKRRITYDYIIKLNSSSSPYQVQRLKPDPKKSVFVSPGDEFGFDKDVIRFKAVGFEAKKTADPTVGEKDVSELTMIDKATNKEFKLVRGSETNLAEYEAEFEFLLGDRPTRTVKKGDTFQIPGIGTTYRLLEIEENSAVIQPVDGGEAITVTRG